jgi:hypothetical protein
MTEGLLRYAKPKWRRCESQSAGKGFKESWAGCRLGLLQLCWE